jgi:hypothetical protein
MSFMLLGILNSQAAGGGAADWEIIGAQTLGANTATVTFSSIPDTFKHLQLWINGWSTGGGQPYMAFNGTGSVDTFRFTASSGGIINDRLTNSYMGLGVIGSNNLKRITSVTTIPNYTNTNVNKNYTSVFGQGYAQEGLNYGNRYGTAAIDTITLTTAGSYAAGTTFQLIGMP